MQTCEIRILPEAEDFLTLLPQTLVKEGYGRILVKHITNNWVEGQYIRLFVLSMKNRAKQRQSGFARFLSGSEEG